VFLLHASPSVLQKVIGCKLHEPRNIVLMQKQLEKRFDNWDWTIVPEGLDAFRVGLAVGLRKVIS